MTYIKITGIIEPEDAELAASLGVDFVACVLHPASPRYVTTEQVWRIRRALRGRAGLIGVFVDTPALLVQRLVDHCQFDSAQLFGTEPRTAVDGLRPSAFKAVSVSDEEGIEQALRTYVGRRAHGAMQPGLLLNLVDGLDGRWSVAAPAARRTALILAASGLDEATVAEAVGTARPWAVDAWDAVEESPGKLDPARLEAFVGAVRAADATGR